MGKLHLIIGPMFSGKSASLLALCRRYRAIGKSVIMINHISDTRYCVDGITTHDGDTMICHRLDRMEDMPKLEDYRSSDVILINEGQFFSDIVQIIEREADTTDKIFVVCGLSGGYERQSVGHLLDLIPHAETVEKLTGFCHVCADGTNGEFTCRRRDVKTDALIGGSELYFCSCRRHFLEYRA